MHEQKPVRQWQRIVCTGKTFFFSKLTHATTKKRRRRKSCIINESYIRCRKTDERWNKFFRVCSIIVWQFTRVHCNSFKWKWFFDAFFLIVIFFSLSLFLSFSLFSLSSSIFVSLLFNIYYTYIYYLFAVTTIRWGIVLDYASGFDFVRRQDR